jgi:LacI family transcriptional regulator
MSLMAFNDGYPAAMMTPPLTVMGVPAWSIGRRAATMLNDLLNGKALEPRVEIFEEELITRQSVQRIN